MLFFLLTYNINCCIIYINSYKILKNKGVNYASVKDIFI